MPLINNTIVFLDTRFFRDYKPGEASYRDLLQYSEDDKIILCTSYIVIEEWRTQKVKNLSDFLNTTRNNLDYQLKVNLVSNQILDRAIQNYLPGIELLSAKSKTIVEQFLRDNKIKKYSPIEKHIEATWDAYFHGKDPFKQAKNKVDIPDSWIFESARDALQEEDHRNLQNRFCVSGDGTLCDALENLGFKPITVVDLLAALQKETQAATGAVEQLPTPIVVTAAETKESSASRLDTVLSTAINSQVKEIYLRLLGYVQWLNTPNAISKEEIIAAIAARGFDNKLIDACAVLLSQKQQALIQDTGNHYLPIVKEICAEAAERVMPEILQMLEQG